MSAREWLIKKGGYFYRPNCAGYTTRKIEAGRYTKEEAEREARVEPWHMSAIHQDEIADDPIPAGYRILAPGEMDRETLEAAASQISELASAYWERAEIDRPDDGFDAPPVTEKLDAISAWTFDQAAAAIRALGGGDKEDSGE